MMFFAIFKPYFLPQVVQQVIKCAFLLIVFLYIVNKGKSRWLANESLPFTCCILLSSIYNTVFGKNDAGIMLDGILYAICFYLIYTCTEFFAKKKRMQVYVDCLFKMALLYCVVSFALFKFPVSHERGVNWIYAFGNKFSTSYYFILLDCLYCIKYAEKIKKRIEYKAGLAVLFVASFTYMYLVDCMTAAFSLIIVIVLFFSLKANRAILTKPLIVAIATIISLVFPFILISMIQNNSIRDFIYITLGRQRSVGGRINIYSIYLFPLLKEQLLLGFGYGSGTMFDKTGGYYGNTQNGMLEHIYNFGILGAIVLFIFIIYCYKNSNRNSATIFASLVVYALIIAGLVEITYGYMFFLGLSLVRWLPDTNNRMFNYG